MTGPVTTLSQQLHWTARNVAAVLQGRSLQQTLPRVPAMLRPGVQALTFHALRHWGWARAAVGVLAERPPEPQVMALLGVALTLLPRNVDGAPTPTPATQTTLSEPVYEPHTVVDQAVAALADQPHGKGPASFVNACLRRYLREVDAVWAHIATDAEVRWNHPFWWVKQVRKDHPQHWQAVLQANNQAAPMVLRVNAQKETPEGYLVRLQSLGLGGRVVGPSAVALDQAVPVEQLPGWSDGVCSVQDLAAQWAAPLLMSHLPTQPATRHGTPRRTRVLDACAAPGGKTAHLLECGAQEVWALEHDAIRATRIGSGLARLGLQAHVHVADAGDTSAWWDGTPFDGILLDAPCTASGIVRRHPDVRWLRRPTDVPQLAAQQKRLLDALWPLLAPGAPLVYCTCSVFKAEGQDQIAAFLARHPEARTAPAPGHLLPGMAMGAGMRDNGASEHDGFFYAVLIKPVA